ncbi:MAG: hypothetical protein F6K40_38455 [Okeania sp. SIO3I5]|uniref:hypothetical protein n=1 Tax=Okeania sp. SIO3I5 TaxID=2607805 RepID=UPI0013B5D2C2|nr:hypothetical protein [Okeania sp. SIO3I5]NEQ41754.1 hypothetical protein [Okeania sp. SIO3I5]
MDCVASFDNTPCVIEFKSANRIKPLADEPLQLGAYCGATNRQYGLRLKNALLIVTEKLWSKASPWIGDKYILYVKPPYSIEVLITDN